MLDKDNRFIFIFIKDCTLRVLFVQRKNMIGRMFNLQAYFDNLSTSELKTIKVGTGTS